MWTTERVWQNLARVEVSDELQVCVRKMGEDLTVDFFPWSHQSDIALRFPFRHSGLEAVGAICNWVNGNGPKYLPIELFSVAKSAVRLIRDQGLKCSEDLKRRLETDGSRWDLIPVGHLSHERPD